MHEHFSVDDDRSSTILTIGTESLFIARRWKLSVTVPFGVDEQLPVSMVLRLPIPPLRPLYIMMESRVIPPLRRGLRTLCSFRIGCCWDHLQQDG